MIQFITRLDSQLKAEKLEVQAYTLPLLANELHVRLQGQGYYMKFNTENDSRVQVGTYLAVIEKLNSAGQAPTEYIDFRIEERAYYK